MHQTRRFTAIRIRNGGELNEADRDSVFTRFDRRKRIVAQLLRGNRSANDTGQHGDGKDSKHGHTPAKITSTHTNLYRVDVVRHDDICVGMAHKCTIKRACDGNVRHGVRSGAALVLRPLHLAVHFASRNLQATLRQTMQCTQVRRSLLATVLTLSCYSAALTADPAPKPITVFAAASLTDALTEISNAYTKVSNVPVRLSFASSSALARQIEGGARADVFFSADVEWADYLQARGLINASTRQDVLGNRLVLIAPADSKLELRIAPNFSIATTLGKGRLATGDPDSVPVGRYARSALASLGVWSAVADRRGNRKCSALAYGREANRAGSSVY